MKIQRREFITLHPLRRLLHRMAIVLTGLLCPAVCLAADPLPRSVLIFNQGATGGLWPSAANQAIRSTLADNLAAPTTSFTEELDLGRFGSPDYEQLLRGYLREKYRQKSIGVIVAVGPDALELLLRLRAELWPKVPIVFAAVDEATAARLKYPSDVTGSIMRLRLLDAVTAARMLVPNFKRIVLVGGPLERDIYRRHFIQELPQFAMGLQLIDASQLTMAEIRERLATLPDDAVIYYTTIYVDGAGVTYNPNDALRLVAEAANRPIVVDAETSIGLGATGGFVNTPMAVGEDAARRVLRILGGENASNIPVTAGDFTKPIFDWRQLKRWNVNESLLAPGSEVRFRPATMWEQYSSQMMIIFAALLFQTAMIGWLLLERRGRQLAELESRVRLREVIHLDRIAVVGAMSASIAHELNQPLGATLANAETAEMLLGANPVDHDQLKEILADIRKSNQRAGDIIAHVRGLLKKQGEPELQEFDLSDAFRDALRTLEPEAKKRGVLVSTSQAQGPLLVRADRVHLEQAMLNLAANAMDAMRDCAPATRKMTVQTVLVGDSEVEVSVSDSGVGIPQDKLSSVFESFYSTKQQGTGLGLTIVRTIVENCGGKIWAENRPRGGAVFRFTLPLAKARPA
jgi:signal transduction histidine kinase